MPGNRGEWSIEGGLLSGASLLKDGSGKHARAVSPAPGFQVSSLSSFPAISLVVSFRGPPRVVLRGYCVRNSGVTSSKSQGTGWSSHKQCTHSSPPKDSRPRLVSVC